MKKFFEFLPNVVYIVAGVFLLALCIAKIIIQLEFEDRIAATVDALLLVFLSVVFKTAIDNNRSNRIAKKAIEDNYRYVKKIELWSKIACVEAELLNDARKRGIEFPVDKMERLVNAVDEMEQSISG